MKEYPSGKIGDFCKTGSGGTPSRSQIERYYENGDIPWVKSGELREGLITATEEHVTSAALKETSIKVVPAGAILLAMYGATVGRLAILGVEATTNQAVCHIVPDPKLADTRYLYHALAAQVPAIIAMGVGGAQPNISQGLIKDLKVQLPTLPEQRRIAAILDQADALRTKRREGLAQLDSLTQSIFIEMFGNPIASHSKWPVETLGSVCSKISDGTHHSPPIQEKGIPYVTAKHLKSYGLDFFDDPWFISEDDHKQIYSRCNPRPDDVLYIKDGATTGIAAVNRYNFEFSMLSSLALLRPSKGMLNPSYLCHWLNYPTVKTEILGAMAGAAIRRLTLAKIKSIHIPLPPLAIQIEFAENIAKIDTLRTKQSDSFAELENLFASLQHRAFRGEL